ncbi:MAG: hypothetical protein WKF75_06970 [Singulisphaera sp.]
MDLPAALTLIDAARDMARRGDRVNRVFIFDRSYGEIAYRLAIPDPVGAERVLGLIVDPYRRGGYVAATCSRMAPGDLPRARRLAETIDDPLHQAYALGLMARALVAADQASAARLLDDAFARIEEHRDDGRARPYPPASRPSCSRRSRGETRPLAGNRLAGARCGRRDPTNTARARPGGRTPGSP